MFVLGHTYNLQVCVFTIASVIRCIQCFKFAMQESSLNETKNDNPKVPITQKPAIAAKPKYIPPVKLKRIPREDVPQQQSLPSRRPNVGDYGLPKEIVRSDKKVEYSERYTTQMEMFQPFASHVPPPEAFKNGSFVEYTVKYEEYTKCTEKCDKFSLHQHKTAEEATQTTKAPNSPSTVCCSILSNAATDCCGIINNPNKKELNGKTMTKVDSVDSNSSDSGGFKDFVQLDVAQKSQNENSGNQTQTHQRMASQGEFLPKDREVRLSHQRKSSQPEFLFHESRQSLPQPKQTYVANAQALAQFLPQEQRTYNPACFDRPDDSGRHHPVGKINVAQTSQMFLEKSEEKASNQKPRPQLIPHSQFQQSTKKIEELLSQRYDKERNARKGQSCLVDGESSLDVEQKMSVQKQIQQKLQADLQQTVKQIQEIQSIELRLPQNRKWTEVCIYAEILSVIAIQI